MFPLRVMTGPVFIEAMFLVSSKRCCGVFYSSRTISDGMRCITWPMMSHNSDIGQFLPELPIKLHNAVVWCDISPEGV